jgi:hypothetical protein
MGGECITHGWENVVVNSEGKRPLGKSNEKWQEILRLI